MFIREVKYTSILMVYTNKLHSSLFVFIYAAMAFSQGNTHPTVI